MRERCEDDMLTSLYSDWTESVTVEVIEPPLPLFKAPVGTTSNLPQRLVVVMDSAVRVRAVGSTAVPICPDSVQPLRRRLPFSSTCRNAAGLLGRGVWQRS